jgi:hypothetical protein
VKLTLTLQLAPAAKVPGAKGQVELAEKSPVATMEDIVSASDCALLSVTDCTPLVAPTT